MKRRLFTVVALMAAICVLLSSCGNVTFLRTVDSLLTPPLYYSEYEGLVKAFNSTIGKNVVLCNPTSGDHLSAITVEDIDGDGGEEAVIFYRDTLDDNKVNFSVFDNDGGVWSQKQEFTGNGNEVSSLTINDFDGDGKNELFIVWYYSGIGNTSVLSLYGPNSSGDSYSELYTKSCDIAVAADMEGDGIPELLYISSDKDEAKAEKNAYLAKLVDGKITAMGKADVDPNVGGYTAVKTEEYNNQYPLKVYIDAGKSSDTMITEILFWDTESEQLVDPVYDPETKSNSATLRFEQIGCEDINGDGRIEIPVQQIYEEDEKTGEISRYLTNWTYFDYQTPTVCERSFVNSDDGYAVLLSAFGNRKINVREQSGQDWSSWVVYAANSGTVGGDVLFSIVRMTIEKYKSGNYDGFVIISDTGSGVVCVNINSAGSSMGLDEEQIKETVTLLS